MTSNCHRMFFKIISIVLAICIFATLFPSRIGMSAYADYTEKTAPSFVNAGFIDSSDWGEYTPDYNNYEAYLRSSVFPEYESIALEKLGKPSTVEDISLYKRADVTYELADITNAYSRNYALNSGNYARLIFGTPVNYRLDVGTWKKMNLSLCELEGKLQTTDTPYSLIFSPFSPTGADIISIGYNGALLSVAPCNTTGSSVFPGYEQQKHDRSELLTDNPCERGTVVYENIFSKTDVSPSASLEYILDPYTIKENIVVSEGGYESYSYSFIFTIENCSAEFDNGSIVIRNESGVIVFTLTSSIMKDAKGVSSDAVSLFLEELDAGYLVTVSAEADWINNEEREFPVRIDPTIVIDYPDEDDTYEAVYVDGITRGYGLAVGNGVRTYLKFKPDILTGLPSGATISDASFTVNAYLMTFVASDTSVRTEKINNNWDPDNVYLGNTTPSVPASYSGLTDSARIQASGYMPSFVSFSLDITDIIREYAAGSNYGFALTTEAPSGTFTGHFTVPMTAVQITFSDNSGLNGYQSTHTISIEGSGTAYIKDINGDLAFIHPGISTKGEILPVSIDLVYSSAFKGTSTDSYYGSGWRLSIIQSMKSETVTDINGDTYTHYVLTDGTGGKHYFILRSGSVYAAEENCFWTYNTVSRLLDYGDGNTAQFNSSGYLTKYINAYGDYYQISYDGATSKVTGISYGSGVIITFVYGQQYLSSMINPSCVTRAVSMSYTGNNLTRISTQNGESTNFVYNTSGLMSRFGYRKTSSETVDRQYVSWGHSSSAVNGIYPVTYFIKYDLESGGSYSMKEIAYISYGDHTEYGHRYGWLSLYALYTEHIYFDRSGRTTSVFDSLGNVSGSDYEGGEIGKMNLLSGNTSAVMTDGNLVKDFSKKTSNWTKLTVTGSGSFYSVTSNSPFPLGKYGTDCFRLISNSETTEIYAKYHVPAAVPGKTYTLSAEIEPTGLCGSGGVVLGIMYNTSESTGIKMLSSPMHYETSVCAQYTFEIPSDAVSESVSILIGIKNQQGDLYFDLVSITEGAVSRPTNQLSDSGFYYGTSAWTQSGTFSAAIETADRIRSIIVPGAINEEHSLSQILPTSVFDGGYLVVSGFGKGKAVSSGKFGITVHFANTNYDDVELLFSNSTKGWQFVSVIIPITDFSSYVSISLVNDHNYTDVCFGGIVAEYVTGLGDYSDRSQYLYDDYGRTVYEKSFSGGEKLCDYIDNASESVGYTAYRDKRGNETTVVYDYDDLINSFAVTKTTETFYPNLNIANNIVTETSYLYNLHGSLLESSTFTDGTLTARSLYSYTSDGRFPEKETDTAGRYTIYNYENSTGDLLSVTDGDGKVTSYAYDSYGRLTSETDGNTSFGLSYSQYNTDISHNSISYSIGTDPAGNRTSFSILDSNGNLNRTIANYNYGGSLGKISKLSYGNGQNKYYGYDSLGNLTYIAYTQNATQDTATFAWYYDQNRNVVKYVDRSDPSDPVTKEYSYNQEGKLKYVISSDGNSVLYHCSTSTNTDYEILTTASAGHVYTNYTVQNDAERIITKSGTLGTKTITYDSLGRISSAANGTISKSYEYVDYSTSVLYNGIMYYMRNETALVSEESCSLSAIPTLSYTYYNNGKIKTISENGVQTNYYEYDDLGQLVREDNKKLNNGNGYTIKYAYDNGGNLLGKMIFSYSPGVGTASLYGNATLISLPVYGYNSTDKDLLSTFMGGSYYSYDAVGNPLTYYGKTSYTITWTRGNRLATVTPNGSNYAQSYLYDADGLRTRKTLVSNANVSKRINYFWTGNTLRSEWAEDGSYEIVFEYDAVGRICGFVYSQNSGTATYYKYVRNAQGDVTHIVNSIGSVVAAYTYDTWGQLLSIKDGSGTDITSSTTSIGYINPIRYRGYYYDNETGFYYLQSRYYDPAVGRFLNADSQLNLEEGPLGCNLYAYCGNDPVNNFDPSGRAWWHWVIGAAIVVACAAATVITCGGFAAAATTVGLVASGIAATSTASTIAAGAFIGSATTYGMAFLAAACTSNSVEEFNDSGNWEIIASTAIGGLRGGYYGYTMSKSQTATSSSSQIVSRGSTGRQKPANLKEQLAMEQVKSNPSAGNQIHSIIMNDSRWHSSEGWVKMSQMVHLSQEEIEIHYVYNTILNIYDDFKFNSK